MDSSKRSKPGAGRIIVRHILFFLLFYLVNSGLIFLLREPDKLYVVTASQAAKEKKGEINALIFGSSHTAYGVDPMAFDEALGWTTFNAGSMLQDMQGAYYYLKDFDKSNNIEHVILNLSYSSWASDYKNDTKSLIILDRLSSPLVYAEYAFDTLSLDALYDLIFVPYRYRSNATFAQIAENVSGKLNETYLYSKKDLEGNRREFPYMGFSPKDSSITSDFRRIPEAMPWQQNEKSAENEEYLIRILDYCQEEGIEVILVSTPFTDAYVLQLKEYDEIRAYYTGLAGKYGIKYYDYNMIRKEYFKTETSYYWDDCHHMNFTGAQLFSKSFAGLLAAAGCGENVDALFYSSFEEYVNAYDEIAGVRLRTRDLQDGTYRIRVVSVLGPEVEAEYQVLARLESEDEYTVIRDYSDEMLFVWEPWQIGNYRLRVNARIKGSTAEYEVYNDFYELTMNSKMGLQ